jgi:hypothetical protein
MNTIVTTLLIVVPLSILIGLTIAGNWKMFKKAGQPGWASIIPVYQGWVLAEVGGKPGWWGIIGSIGGGRLTSQGQLSHAETLVYLAIFLVTLVFSALIAKGIAESFGKSTAFALLLIFMPFIAYPILGFGSAQYQARS